MATFCIDTGISNSRQVLSIPRRHRPSAIGLWTLAGSWTAANGTNGHIPKQIIPDLASTQSIAGVLVKAELWDFVANGYQFIDERKPATWTITRDDYRAKIPDDIRQIVYSRDNYRCRHCDTPNNLSVDHIHPWSRGGPDTLSNFQTLCVSCNARKGAN